MQDFKFQSYVEFFESLPQEQKIITTSLRELIFDVIPEAKEKLSFNVPFYSGRKSICYIWPGAIPWGKKKSKEVTLGFTQGVHFNHKGYLKLGDRKRVAQKKFTLVTEIEDDIDILIEILQKAKHFDERELNISRS